jgi:hypothetical protein
VYILSLVSVRLYRKVSRKQYAVDFKLRSGWQTHVLFDKCEISTNVHDLRLSFNKCECTVDVNLKRFVILSDNKTVNNLKAALYRHTVIAESNLTLSDKTSRCMEWNVSLPMFTRKYILLCVCANSPCNLRAMCTVTGNGSQTELWTTASHQQSMFLAVF